MLVRYIEQLGARGPCRGLPVLCTGRARTDVVDRLAGQRSFLTVWNDAAGLEIDALVAVDEVVRVGGYDFARGTVDYIHIAVAPGVDQHLAVLPIDGQLDENVLVDLVMVEQIVRIDLIGPLRAPGIGI